jgi:large subunit ribosomal protein L18
MSKTDLALKIKNKKKSIVARAGKENNYMLCCKKTNKHLHAYVLDTLSGNTVFSCSTIHLKDTIQKTWNIEAAKSLGELVAKKCKDKSINTLFFNKSIYKFHGKVQAFVDQARSCGLVI